jgi:hypothetical protein
MKDKAMIITMNMTTNIVMITTMTMDIAMA